jgi:anthranilate/para-aminobenzoate synthase component II
MIELESLPAVLEISSCTKDGIIMGVRHRDYPIEGIQFHPESILTKTGDQLIKNWLAL